MKWASPLIVLGLLAVSGNVSGGDEVKKGLHPDVHRNHVSKTSANYLSSYRRFVWHYDFDTATQLARQTGRPMWVIFCRAGSIDDPITGEPRCWS
jgi:hypothetical protein